MTVIEIDIVETGRFQLDCGLHGLQGDRHRRALQVLRFDPIVGVQRSEAAALWDWEFENYRLTYMLSDDFSKMLLLRFTPIEAPKADRFSKAIAVIRVINDIKRMFGF